MYQNSSYIPALRRLSSTDARSYRPISNLSILAELLLEGLVARQLKAYLKAHLDPSQPNIHPLIS